MKKYHTFNNLRKAGLSISEYCKNTGIATTTFRDWLKVDEDLGFGKINIKPTITEAFKSVTKKPMIFVNEEMRIELKEGFNKHFLRQIIEVLCNAN